MAAPPLQLRNPSPKTRYAHTQRQRNKIDLGNQSYALQLDVVNFRSANFRSLNAHLRIADITGQSLPVLRRVEFARFDNFTLLEVCSGH